MGFKGSRVRIPPSRPLIPRAKTEAADDLRGFECRARSPSLDLMRPLPEPTVEASAEGISEAAKSRRESGQAADDDPPDELEVHRKVPVDDPVPEADDPRPLQLRCACPELVRHVSGSLSENLEVTDDGVGGLLVGEERRLVHSRDVSLDPVRRLEHVVEREADGASRHEKPRAGSRPCAVDAAHGWRSGRPAGRGRPRARRRA